MYRMAVLVPVLMQCALLLAQDPIESIYDDDPMQRFPIGVKESTHQIFEANGGTIDHSRVEPPFWWTGMVNTELQILLYDQNIADFKDVEIDYPGVSIVRIDRVENPNYIFLTLNIAPETEPGHFSITLAGGFEQYVYQYELREKPEDPSRIQGIDASDILYLVMPDRFSNGDPSNDSFEDMKQVGVNRDKLLFRHGGDLVGVMEHLDYLEELGMTGIWLNPVFENDQPYDSYHGYSITDFYRVDKRLGTNEQYRHFVELCHARGMKVVMDVIFNHVGDEHWWIQDLPSSDWIHQFDQYTASSFRAPVLMDPYAAEKDKEIVSNGWFDRHMPDLNQQNEFLATYLIQNSIWWTLFSGLDAFRIDTYFYPDPKFMATWGQRMQEEFPKLSFFGETWVHGAVTQAQFTQNNQLRENFNSHLPAVTDFQMHYAFYDALKQEQSWTGGVSKIYYTLAKDFVYEDPYRNVLFLDNHDKSRLFSELGEDVNKLKSGLAMLLTMRGIPCIYYGTEILLKGVGGMFGEAGRVDFPGGWRGDSENKFRAEGRSEQEQDVFEFVQALARYRSSTTALQDGKLMQFVPENGIYVYFRYDDATTVMIIYNSNDRVINLDTARFSEQLDKFTEAINILSGQSMPDISNLNLQARETLMLELH